MEMEQPFHTTIFGGFRKSDVLSYIENAARTHAQEMEELKAELERVRQASVQAETRAEEAEGRLAEAGSQATRSDEAMGELEETRTALTQAQEELKELRAKMAAALPKAEAYDAVKDRTAGVELEAHHRAKQILEEAQQDARKVYAGTEQWMIKVRGTYERLRTDLETTILHAAEELERSGKAMADSTREFKAHDGALKELMELQKQAAQQKKKEGSQKA